MKILLVNTFWSIRNTQSIWRIIAGLTPPMGLMSIAAFLEQHGIEVNILETNAAEFTIENLSKHNLEQYDYIGISATTNVIRNAYTLIEAIKALVPQAKIIVGGVHATILPEEVVRHPQVDFVVQGEGEQVLAQLLTTNDVTTVPNLHYKHHGQPCFTFSSEQAIDLDQLPLPAYHKIDIRHYSLALGSYRRLPGIGIVVSRGCPSQCTYCHGPLFGRKVRFRSIENILAEIELLISQYGIREIAFYDDNFTIYQQLATELCQQMLARDFRLSWSCFSKVSLINEELLAVMHRAGCHQILYGVESGSPEILKNIKKQISLQKTEEIVRLTQKYHIDVRAAFMFGNPGETPETLQQTLDFAIRLNPDRAVFNITTPFPGTEMFEWAQHHGYLLTTEWEEYDLSKPVMALPTVSCEEIIRYYRLSYNRFYVRWSYILRQLRLLRNWRSLPQHAKAALRLIPYLFARK